MKKKVSSESPFTSKNISKTNMQMNFNVWGQQGMDFITGGRVIMDHFGQKQWFEVKNFLMMVVSLKHAAYGFSKC